MLSGVLSVVAVVCNRTDHRYYFPHSGADVAPGNSLDGLTKING